MGRTENVIQLRFGFNDASRARSRLCRVAFPRFGDLAACLVPDLEMRRASRYFLDSRIAREDKLARAQRGLLENPSRRPGGPASQLPSSRTPESSACSETAAADSGGALGIKSSWMFPKKRISYCVKDGSGQVSCNGQLGTLSSNSSFSGPPYSCSTTALDGLVSSLRCRSHLTSCHESYRKGTRRSRR